MSEENQSGMPTELIEALLQRKQSSVAHDAAHMINLLSEAAHSLGHVVHLTNNGESTLKGVLQAIDQQVGMLEGTKATKQ